MDLSNTISSSISALAKLQEKNGIFINRSSLDSENFTSAHTLKTTFSTSIITLALLSAQKHKTSAGYKKIVSRGQQFLLNEKSLHGSFNYWSRNSSEATTIPYPDDLDDTFAALAVLTLSSHKKDNGTLLAHAVKILTTSEVAPGGPYRTWLISKDAPSTWQDIDVAVNANIGYFLSLEGISVPGINTLIEESISSKNIRSPYYPSLLQPAYFIARWYTGNSKKLITAIFKEQKNGQWKNPLETAIAVSSLIRLGVSPTTLTQHIEFIQESQENNIWKAYGFCFDPTKKGAPYYHGSPALTTALCIEALALYEEACIHQTHNKKSEEEKHTYIKISNAVVKLFLARIKRTPEAYKVLRPITKKLQGTGKIEQITLVSEIFKKSLGKNAAHISDSLILELGCANLAGWTAYTMYDNILDKEGDVGHIPAANVCLRQTTQIYDSLLSSQWKKYIHSILDTIEEANSWEYTHSQFSLTTPHETLPKCKNDTILAEKSIGHATGPLVLLAHLHKTPSSPPVSATYEFFTHFIIAKQLNDDAHDWISDLERGFVNSASVPLLATWQSYKKDRPKDTEAFLNELQEIFWKETIHSISAKIVYHTKKAQKALKKNKLITNPEPLLALLTPLERAARTAVQESNRTRTFIDTYTS